VLPFVFVEPRSLARAALREEALVDVESMTMVISDDSPCGESLEYDPAFADLEIAARGKPEQHFGNTLVPAQEPDWRQVHDKALALMERTRDLRIAVLLVRAQTVLEGLPGLAGGLELVRQLLAQHWDHVHPQLDAEDDNDPILRMNALAALVDPAGLLRDLRSAPFVRSAAGSCSIRDAEMALGIARMPDDQPPPFTRAQLTGLVRAHAAVGGRNEAQRTLEAVAALVSVLVEKAGHHEAVDLGPLTQQLRPLAAFHAEVSGEAAAFARDAGPADGADQAANTADYGADAGAQTRAPGGDAGPTAYAAGPAARADIRSRDDALRELDRVCAWLERHEPANPAPLLIRRAQRLMHMNFVDILRDIAPEGMPSIEKIAGLPPAE
jgi:type VI secretion system protein ImpA